MSTQTGIYETLELYNKALDTGIKQLHVLQGARKKGSLHLMIHNWHTPHCLGCPHYHWKVWTTRRATKGPGIGKFFPLAVEVKAPTRTDAARNNPKVMEMVVILSKLLEKRAALVDAISRTERVASAAMKHLSQFA